VPRFPALGTPLPAPPKLRQFLVSDALPVGRRTVTLRLRSLSTPAATVGIPLQRPNVLAVPSLVGVPYQTVVATLPSGLYLRVRRIGPLPAAASVRGLDALVVSAEEPAAGTVLPAYGVPIPNGVNLGPSVVTVTVAARGPRAEPVRPGSSEGLRPPDDATGAQSGAARRSMGLRPCKSMIRRLVS
jgi:hypothetical protein